MNALLDTLASEMDNCWNFLVNLNLHCGKEGVKRLFRTLDGKCHKCKAEPDFYTKVFRFLQLELPENVAKSVTVEGLLRRHFSVQTQDETMKCSHCCPHPGATCPHTGDCSRPVDTRNILTKMPEYLFIQLLRWNRSGTIKNNMMVEVGAQMNIDGVQYELIGTVDHRSNTLGGGHYVAYVRKVKGPWVFCDDSFISGTSLDKVNNNENYIFLLKKIETCSPEMGDREKLKEEPVINQAEEDSSTSHTVNEKHVLYSTEDMKRVTLKFVKETPGIKDLKDIVKKNRESESKVKFDVQCPGILVNMCRGCGKGFQQILRHLQPQKKDGKMHADV